MKITKKNLQKLIEEEILAVLKEKMSTHQCCITLQ